MKKGDIKPIIILIGLFLLVFGEHVFLNNFSTYRQGLTSDSQIMRELDPEFELMHREIQTAVYNSIISFFCGLGILVFGLKMKVTQVRVSEP